MDKINPQQASLLQRALFDLNAVFSNETFFPSVDTVPTQSEIEQAHFEQVSRERSSRPALDKLLKNWISDRHEFSLDSSATAYLMRARFSEAKHFAEFLIDNDFQTSDHSRESLLQFLLIKYWAAHGALRFRHRLNMP